MAGRRWIAGWPAGAVALLALGAPAPIQAADTVVEGAVTARAVGVYRDGRRPGEGEFDALGAFVVDGTVERTTDRGLSYGFTIKVGSGDYGRSGTQPGSNEDVAANEAYLFLETGWGRVRVGDEDGAAARATDLLPGQLGGQVDGDWMDAAGLVRRWKASGRDSDDATKILIETQRLGGVRLGASYAPERDSLVEDIVAPGGGTKEKDIVELGVSYRGDWGPASYEVGGGYVTGQAGRRAPRGTEVVSLAAQAFYAGFSLGAVWFDGHGGAPLAGGRRNGGDGLSLQVAYRNGPLGATLFRTDRDGVEAADAYGLGVMWEVTQTVTVGIDLVDWDAADRSGFRRDGKMALATVQAGF